MRNKSWTVFSNDDFKWAAELVKYADDAEMSRLAEIPYYTPVALDSIVTSQDALLQIDADLIEQGYQRSRKIDGIRVRCVLLGADIFCVQPKSAKFLGRIRKSHPDYDMINGILSVDGVCDFECYVEHLEGHSIVTSVLSHVNGLARTRFAPTLDKHGQCIAPKCDLVGYGTEYVEGYIYSRGNKHIKVKLYHLLKVDIMAFEKTTTGLISALINHNDKITKAKIVGSKNLSYDALKPQIGVIRCRVNQASDIEEVYLDWKGLC